MDDGFSDIFEDKDLDLSGDDLLAILDSLEDFTNFPPADKSLAAVTSKQNKETTSTLEPDDDSLTQLQASTKTKRQKLSESSSEEPKISHITVERNRRKQMNEHLSVLRSLMPCFYVKRGDQASIIGGVVEYINELQQLLQSLEAKKQRKAYNEVLSPRLVSSPRLSPRVIAPVSPRLNLPISPGTPQSGSPYKPQPRLSNSLEPSPTSSASSSFKDNLNELVANSKLVANSPIADVEVKFSGPHVLLKTLSPPIPGQALKIISALEDLALEILQISITSADESVLNSFTIKIGVECQLSAEDLAQQVQHTFSPHILP
ncbi:transcription factor SPEECHLESS-like [Prosopis cineraria]|uniref:transcription factor SPEECHLESS-like n=1 Tax=Prosopis cineraria TaxID=364024 RepID=UPI00240EA808|nr:transcription factor SPEECHLESS-like [Prosopis cineraria]